ncbi:MAG: glycosyltransferase family 4 protein [Anaerolineae bacterium]
MRVCYWGTYDADYVRNRVIIQGLRANGVEVVECHSPLWSGTADKVRQASKGPLNPRLWLRLARTYLRLLWRTLWVGRYDVLIVGYAGHLDVFPARVLAWLKRKPLVFDAYLSLHETVVEDRGLAGRRTLLAGLLYRVEKAGCALADLVLLDTEADIAYFVAKYNLPKERFARVWVGAEEEIYHPLPAPEGNEAFTALFFGKFIPLHGIEHILGAAQRLRDRPEIRFAFIGDGQTYDAMRRMAEELGLDNVIWGPRWLEPPDLARRIAAADVCLGIFGTSAKALRVIPTKAFVALAMGKPLITADSPAARELFTPGVDALLCPPGDPEALAEAIAKLCSDRHQTLAIAGRGQELYATCLTPPQIVQPLLSALHSIR